MKKVNIIGPTPVNGEMRFIHENPLTVSNEEAKRLHDAGLLQADPAGLPGPKPAGTQKRRPARVATPPAPPAPAPATNSQPGTPPVTDAADD